MATTDLSIDAKRYSILYSGATLWSDWVSPTGSNTTWPEYHYMVFHKVNLYKGADVQALNRLSITVPVSSSNGVSGRIQAVLFTSDVTGMETFPTSGGRAFPYSEINLGVGRSTTYSAEVSLSGITADTVYIGYYAEYSSGNIKVNSEGTSIVENYTAKALPQISFGNIGKTDTGMSIPIYNGSNYNLTCTITAGTAEVPGNNALLYRGTSSNGVFNVPIDAVQWFNKAEITDSLELPTTITVTGGNPSPISRAGYWQEDRQTEIDKMKPVIASLDKQIQQAPGGATDYYPKTYIAGFSKCKVTAVITRPTLATISTVYLSYPGGRTVTMTEDDPINSPGTYSGTTFSALAKDTEFTVSVTDERGLRNTDTAQVTGVVPYVLPSVSIDPANTYRCNSEGVKTNGGNHYKIKVTAQINTSFPNNVPNNAITELTVGLKGAPALERHTIPDGTTSDTLPPASAGDTGTLPDPKKAYVLTIIIQDRISGQVVREYTLKGMQRDMVLAHHGGVTQLGVGTTPEETDQNSIELPKDGVFLLGGIPAQAFNIPYSDSTDGSSFGKNFLSVNYDERTAATNASAYFFIRSDDMKDYSNYPVMSYDGHDDFYKDYGWVGFRTVSILGKDLALVQIIEFMPIPGRIWINAHVKTLTENKWVGWKYHPPKVI